MSGIEERISMEKQTIYNKQKNRYTALLQEFGKTLQEYEQLEKETTELDQERNKLKEQLKIILNKIGFANVDKVFSNHEY